MKRMPHHERSQNASSTRKMGSSSLLIIIEGCSDFYEDRYDFKIICEEVWSDQFGADLESLFQKWKLFKRFSRKLRLISLSSLVWGWKCLSQSKSLPLMKSVQELERVFLSHGLILPFGVLSLGFCLTFSSMIYGYLGKPLSLSSSCLFLCICIFCFSFFVF